MARDACISLISWTLDLFDPFDSFLVDNSFSPGNQISSRLGSLASANGLLMLPGRQSWALSVFFNFVTNKKYFFAFLSS